jgi:hypothetical protein
MFAVVKERLFAVAQHASSVCWSKGQSRVLSFDLSLALIQVFLSLFEVSLGVMISLLTIE